MHLGKILAGIASRFSASTGADVLPRQRRSCSKNVVSQLGWCLNYQGFVFSTGENFVADKIVPEKKTKQENQKSSRGRSAAQEEISACNACVGWRELQPLLCDLFTARAFSIS